MTTCSIIIPCYNYADYLSECLDSVVSQTYVDWEAIIVDDASTKGNVDEVVALYNDPRIHILHHPNNLGLAAARNTGIKSSKSELIIPLDSDDKLSSQYLEDLVLLLQNHPECDCVFPDFYYFGSTDGVIQYELKQVKDLLIEQWIPGPGTLLRKSIWQKVGGYCEDTTLRIGNEDWDFYLGAAENDFKAIHLPIPLYYYRQHEGSLITKLKFYDYKTREFMYHRHKALFDSYEMKEQFLSDGYFHSAQAWWFKGDRLHTFSLAFHCARFKPHRKEAIILGGKSLIPGFLIKGIKSLLKSWENFKNASFDEISHVLYHSENGRKLFWRWVAKDTDKKYGGVTHDFEIINEVLNIVSPKRLLEFGCGSGRLFQLFLSREVEEIVGQDISKPALNIARQRYSDVKIQLFDCSLQELKFPLGYFDLVVCNRVLQHIPRNEIGPLIKNICSISSYVYVNESEEKDNLPTDFKVTYHDYVKLFKEQNYLMIRDGLIPNETGTRQHWRLFRRID